MGRTPGRAFRNESRGVALRLAAIPTPHTLLDPSGLQQQPEEIADARGAGRYEEELEA